MIHWFFYIFPSWQMLGKLNFHEYAQGPNTSVVPSTARNRKPCFCWLKQERAYIISSNKKFSRHCSFLGSISSFHRASVLRTAPDKTLRSWVWPHPGEKLPFLSVSFTSSILSHHTSHVSQARLSSFAHIYITHSQEKWEQHSGPKPALVSRWPRKV